MKKLLFGVLTAFGIALGANAALGTAETTFENIGNKETADATVTVKSDVDPVDLTLMTGKYWSVDGVGNDVPTPTTSKVTAYEAQGVEKNNVNGGYGEIGNSVETGMTYAPGSNYLSIDADSVLLRKIENTVTLDSTYYIDTMVKFTATDLADGTMMGEIATGEKIVVWMYQPSEAVEGEEIPAPVLKVAAGYIGADKVQGNAVTAVDKKVYTAAGNFQENTWYRLSVKAINNAYEGASAVYFVVCIDGVPLTYVTTDGTTDKFYDTASYDGIFATPSMAYRSLSSSILPSLVPDATTLTGLGFKGNGAVDNILFSASAPCDNLIDDSTVPLFQVGAVQYATFDEAVAAALKADQPIIKLIADTEKAQTHLPLDFNQNYLTEDKTLVLDLNGKTLKAFKPEGAQETDEGVSIEITNNSKFNVAVQIISTVDGANVQGKVQGSADIIIGDVSGTYDDKGVTYAGTFDAWGNPFTLYKGKFWNDPTANDYATPAPGYELVKQGDYWTIAEKTTTDVKITLGDGIVSATYQIGDAEAVTIDAEETIYDVAIGAIITVTGKAKDGYTAVDIGSVKVSATTTTIEVKATLNQYDLTVTVGEEGVASVTVKVNGEVKQFTSGTPIKVSHGATVTIESAAFEGYKLDGEETSTFTMKKAESVSVTATKNAPTTGTLVIYWTDKNVKSVSYTIDGDTKSATSREEINVQVGKKVTITATVADWYKANVPAVIDMTTAERKEVEITATKIASSDIGASTKPADVGITGGAFENAGQADLQKVVTWAAANGVSVAVVNAMDFTSKGTDEQELFEEAYLLNCGTGDVAGEKAKFKITSFTLVNGILTPTLPDDSKYNGTVKEMGTGSISGNNTTWTEVTTNPDNRKDFKFFKAVLTK